jgi:hypothetical protein
MIVLTVICLPEFYFIFYFLFKKLLTRLLEQSIQITQIWMIGKMYQKEPL